MRLLSMAGPATLRARAISRAALVALAIAEAAQFAAAKRVRQLAVRYRPTPDPGLIWVNMTESGADLTQS
jgi:hypothetical protein